MRLVPTTVACLVFALSLAERSQALESADLAQPGATNDLWTSRVGAFLGPQYFLEHDDLVQFSFGAEGHLHLVGPLSVGVALGVGVVADTSASGQASLRVHLLRKNRLSLGLDIRGGVLIWLYGDDTRVEPVLQGGIELTHDLGDSFWILVRAGLGWVPGDDRGTLADLTVGLGIFL